MDGSKIKQCLLAAIPLAALIAMVWLFLSKYERMIIPELRQSVAPIENIEFEGRVIFEEGARIRAFIRNTGPETVTIAEVMVNEGRGAKAFIHPSNVIEPMKRAELFIQLDWVEAEAYTILLLTENGTGIEKEIEVAALTPKPGWKYVGVFGLLGLYVGVIPIYLGLVWFPFLRRIKREWIDFLLAFTVGLLVFLGVDALLDAVEISHHVITSFQPNAIILIALTVSFLGLVAVSEKFKKMGRGKGEGYIQLMLSYMIATGIGLHNLGEGLAIGAAYAEGLFGLGALLVVGFAIHNTTEGIAIVAPVTRSGIRISHLVILGLVAGIPTIAGAWIGGFSSSEVWSVLFLSLGAGAIFQVVYTIVKQMGESPLKVLSKFPNLSGLLFGLIVMYATASILPH